MPHGIFILTSFGWVITVIDYGIVESNVRPQGLQITELKVFVNTNIEVHERQNEDGLSEQYFTYQQVGYDKDEYIHTLDSQVTELQDGMVELADLILG